MRLEYPARFTASILLGVLLLLLFGIGTISVRAEEVAEYPDIWVNRFVEIENGGALVVNDTVTLSADAGENVRSLDSFRIGFPFRYRNALAHVSAYDSTGRLQTGPDAPLDEAGFSWIDVSFSQPVDVSRGGQRVFSVIFVFSGLVEANQTLFHVDFPAYPSLTVEAVFCNVTVTLPEGVTLNATSPGFMNRTLDSQLVLYSERAPLEAYSNVSSWAEFRAQNFLLLEVDEWRREVTIDGLGGFTVTDFYQLTNRGDRSILKIPFMLPLNATDVSVQDVYGLYARVTVTNFEDSVEADTTLREALAANQKTKLLIACKLPFWKYIVQSGWQDYTLDISLVRPDWIVKRFMVTVSLPEGAEFRSSSATPQDVQKEGFLVKVRFAGENLTKFFEPSINVDYRYFILWASFRPTIWVGTIAAIAGGLVFFRRTPKPEAVVAMPVSTETLSRFVNMYEERRRLKSALKSLEQQAERGKISRRRYRLQRSSLDGRLSRLYRDIAELRSKIAAAGGHYSERMKRLETAEAEIETMDRDIERVEVRFRRREISAEARRRLLDEYNRIKERAENTIAETLLRLRE